MTAVPQSQCSWQGQEQQKKMTVNKDGMSRHAVGLDVCWHVRTSSDAAAYVQAV